jgi:quercetin dioxygenase-like cupin family protein
MSSPPRVAVLDADERCPRLPLVVGPGEAYAVVWPGVGAEMRSMHRISLGAGSTTVPQRHPMEAVYSVIAGEGAVRDPDTGAAEALVDGSIFHVEPGTAYVVEAGANGIELVGGPCPADPALYRTLAAA